MAFTSDMIPRLVYLYADHPGNETTMRGYINNSLSVYEISKLHPDNKPDNEENPPWFNESIITTCRYVAGCVFMYKGCDTPGTSFCERFHSNQIQLQPIASMRDLCLQERKYISISGAGSSLYIIFFIIIIFKISNNSFWFGTISCHWNLYALLGIETLCLAIPL